MTITHERVAPAAGSILLLRTNRCLLRFHIAYGDAETKRKALENGAEGLFTKPIDFGTLRGEIDTRIERAV